MNTIKKNLSSPTEERIQACVSAFWADGGEFSACDIPRRAESVASCIVFNKRLLRLRMSGDVPKGEDENVRVLERSLPVGWSLSSSLYSDTKNDTTVTRKVLWVNIDAEKCARHPLATEFISIMVLTFSVFAIMLLFLFRFFYIY